MKRIIFILLLSLPLIAGTAYGQFIPPFLPEHTYPLPTQYTVDRTLHTSNYERANVDFPDGVSNLFVYSWDGLKGGIAWRRMDQANTATLDEGALSLPADMQEIEVALIADQQGAIYVIAAYYQFDPTYATSGHYYKIYKWEQNGLVLQDTKQISTAPYYGRISIDAHGLYIVGIVWQESTDNGNLIQTKIGSSGNNTIDFSDNSEILNAAGGMIPDIAFGHPFPTSQVPVARISYVDPSGNIVVAHINYSYLMASPANYMTIDDINYSVYPFVTPTSFRQYAVGNCTIYPNLDCPDHYFNNEDNWSYIYTRDYYNINVRIRTNAGINTYNLTDNSIFTPALNGYANGNTTIAYHSDGNSIYYGWFFALGSPANRYLAVHLQDNGNPVTPGYQIVANSSDYSGTPFMSFAKESGNFWSSAAGPNLFAVYPMYDIPSGGYYIKSKLVPWGSPSFKPGATGIKEEQGLSGSMMAFPNPFRNDFSLNIDADNGTKSYVIELLNIQGSLLRSCKGNLKQINRELSAFSQKLGSGIYLIRNNTPGAIQTLKVVKAG